MFNAKDFFSFISLFLLFWLEVDIDTCQNAIPSEVHLHARNPCSPNASPVRRFYPLQYVEGIYSVGTEYTNQQTTRNTTRDSEDRPAVPSTRGRHLLRCSVIYREKKKKRKKKKARPSYGASLVSLLFCFSCPPGRLLTTELEAGRVPGSSRHTGGKAARPDSPTKVGVMGRSE